MEDRRTVNYPGLKAGAWSRKATSQVETGKGGKGIQLPADYVSNRSFRRTSRCFLSLLHCKALIMQTKGKGSKVLVADREGQEPVIDIPEGRFAARLTSPGP